MPNTEIVWIGASETAAILGVGTDALRRPAMDDLLQPARDAHGWRIYRLDRVQAFAGMRTVRELERSR